MEKKLVNPFAVASQESSKKISSTSDPDLLVQFEKMDHEYKLKKPVDVDSEVWNSLPEELQKEIVQDQDASNDDSESSQEPEKPDGKIPLAYIRLVDKNDQSLDLSPAEIENLKHLLDSSKEEIDEEDLDLSRGSILPQGYLQEP